MEHNMDRLKWAGTATSILGAVILAAGLGHSAIMLTGYILFVVGSGAWFAVVIIKKDKALLALNEAFLGADFLGIYNIVLA